MGLLSNGIELKTDGEDGGELGMVAIGTDPVDAGCEMDVCAVEDMSWCGRILIITGSNVSVSGGL